MELHQLLNIEDLAQEIADHIKPSEILRRLPDNRRVRAITLGSVNSSDWVRRPQAPVFVLLKQGSDAVLTVIGGDSHSMPVKFYPHLTEWGTIARFFHWQVVCSCCDGAIAMFHDPTEDGPRMGFPPDVKGLGTRIEEACQENGITRLFIKVSPPDTLEGLREKFSVRIENAEGRNPFWFVY